MNERKTAFVTGGGTGIGKGIALSLAKAGYNIVVSYCGSKEGAKEVVSSAKDFGVDALSVKADVSKVCDIEEMFKQAEDKFKKIDLFVNNAGVTKKAEFINTDEALFDQICSVDYKGAFFCIQRAAKNMIKNSIKGNIVLISSNNSVAHFADVSVYASAKAAAEKMSAHAAIELAKYGIRVNVIAPGWVDTGAERLDNKEDTYYKIPLKKWATPQEIGSAVLFLDSSGASSVTGAVIRMDNGACLVSDKRERYGY